MEEEKNTPELGHDFLGSGSVEKIPDWKEKVKNSRKSYYYCKKCNSNHKREMVKLPCFTNRTFSKPKIIHGPRQQDDIYRCQMCQFQLKKKVKLQTHMLDAHGETCFFCEHCGAKFKNRSDIKNMLPLFMKA